MYKETYLLSANNTKINLRYWNAKSKNDKVIIVTHGYGEHQGYYEDFAKFFTGEDYNVITYDLRSYGKSEGKRGHVPSFDLFLDDLENIINYARNTYNMDRVYLFGHSLGGNIVANYLIDRKVDNVVKAVLSAPWFKLAFEPPKIKLFMAKLGNYFFPSVAIKGELNIDHLSRDENFKQRYKNDPMTYDKISPSYYFAIRNAGLNALAKADKVKVPVMIFQGDDDKVTSVTASKQFCEKTGDNCTFKLWTGGYRHVVFSEENKDIIFEDINKFLSQ